MAGEVAAQSTGLGGLTRPAQLKGLHNSSIRKNIAVAIGLSIVGGIAFYYLVAAPRKQKYAEFYKNYDANAAFERMKKAGIFQSADN